MDFYAFLEENEEELVFENDKKNKNNNKNKILQALRKFFNKCYF